MASTANVAKVLEEAEKKIGLEILNNKNKDNRIGENSRKLEGLHWKKLVF